MDLSLGATSGCDGNDLQQPQAAKETSNSEVARALGDREHRVVLQNPHRLSRRLVAKWGWDEKTRGTIIHEVGISLEKPGAGKKGRKTAGRMIGAGHEPDRVESTRGSPSDAEPVQGWTTARANQAAHVWLALAVYSLPVL